MSESKDTPTCEVCGDKILDMGPQISGFIHPWTCGRCGKVVCFGCGGYSSGNGYGEEDKKYGDLCLECYWELRDSYAERWESEFGGEASFDNPYELSEDDRELRERIRTRAWRSEDG